MAMRWAARRRLASLIVVGCVAMTLAGTRAEAKASGHAGFSQRLVAERRVLGEPRAVAVPGSNIVYVLGYERYHPGGTVQGGAQVWRSDDGGRTYGPGASTGQGNLGDADLAI